MNRTAALLFTALSIATGVSTAVAQVTTAAGKHVRESFPLASTPEYLAAVKALRAMEAKLQTGLSYHPYVEEVAELNVSLSALEEVADSRRATKIAGKIKEIRANYVLASSLWEACLTSSEDCSNDMVTLSDVDEMPAIYANQILETYPELRKSMNEGGAISNFSKNWAYMPKLLSRVWADAKENGVSLRASVSKK